MWSEEESETTECPWCIAEAESMMGIDELLQSMAKVFAAMTPEEFRAMLVRAGILSPDGSLTPPYQKKG
jgi:uncharacterized protein CbrC (UPF0167 family)